MVAPGYTYLQDMVSRVVTDERRRIKDLLEKAMTPNVEKQLDALLESEEGMYRISLLKHEPKDFSYSELRQEVGRRKFFQPLYEFGQSFLSTTGLSNESVKYYASLWFRSIQPTSSGEWRKLRRAYTCCGSPFIAFGKSTII